MDSLPSVLDIYTLRDLRSAKVIGALGEDGTRDNLCELERERALGMENYTIEMENEC